MTRTLISCLLFAATIFAADELPIAGVARAGFKSSDLDKTRSYYAGVLGFHEAFDIKDSSGKVTAAFFKINDEQYVEITPSDPENNRLEFIQKKLDMHIGRNRKWQLNLFDPDGTRTELMEPNTQPQAQ